MTLEPGLAGVKPVAVGLGTSPSLPPPLPPLPPPWPPVAVDLGVVELWNLGVVEFWYLGTDTLGVACGAWVVGGVAWGLVWMMGTLGLEPGALELAGWALGSGIGITGITG